MPTLAAVLSENNRALLRLIRDRRPKSLTALAELTGRRVPNLSRSLRMMEGYGLVKLKRDGYGVEPVALATEFLVVLNDPARE
nr:helix-turn-helix domain-containing protein [Verminephrobacter eiseniae]